MRSGPHDPHGCEAGARGGGGACRAGTSGARPPAAGWRRGAGQIVAAPRRLDDRRALSFPGRAYAGGVGRRYGAGVAAAGVAQLLGSRTAATTSSIAAITTPGWSSGTRWPLSSA